MQMADQVDASKAYDSKDFMLAEYHYHMEEFRRSKQLGEARLNLFLTIATAVLGGSGLIVGYLERNSVLPPQYLIILFFAYLATIMFGSLTLLRIIHRDIVSTKELQALNRIRRYFVNMDCSLLSYLQYIPYDNEPKTEWKWSVGGLAENVVLTNALLAAIMTYILAEIELLEWIKWFAGLFAFIVVLFLQVRHVKGQYCDAMQKADTESKYPHQPKSNSIEKEIL
jgi:hypothetical protein